MNRSAAATSRNHEHVSGRCDVASLTLWVIVHWLYPPMSATPPVSSLNPRLTSPVHIDDKADFARTTAISLRGVLLSVELDRHGMREEEIMAYYPWLRVRVALWRDLPVGRTAGCVTAKAVAEQGVDVGF